MEDLSFLDEESKKLLVNFVLRYIELQKKQKDTKRDIKSLKKEFNELGLPTRLALKAYKRMSDEKKRNADDELNIDAFKDIILSNRDIQNAFVELEEE